MAGDDYLVLGVLRGIVQTALQVPNNVSVAGFDNTILANQLTPTLTSIDIGKTAIRLLFESNNNPTMPLKTVELLPRLGYATLLQTHQSAFGL